jgi:D-serine deaminase-like pyridoxal phosphate-dependent protein
MPSPTHIDDLPTPCLLVEWPVAQRNIDRAASFVEGRPVRLRPHFKNHKCVPLAKAQLAAGGCCGITTATADEAAGLVDAGVDDILIANQLVGPRKIEDLIDLAARATVRTTVDSMDNARRIAEAASAKGIEVGVLAEIDVGSHRLGVQAGEPAITLAKQLVDTPGIRFDGLQAYHGHLVNMQQCAERDEQARDSMLPVVETRQALEAAGVPCPIVSGAGTATYRTVGEMQGIDELQIGSYVTLDWSYKERVGDEFDIAMSVLATVVSAHRDRYVLDAGVKAIAHEYGPPCIRDEPEAQIPVFRAEEHTIVRTPDHHHRIGDRVRMIPSHCCATSNLHAQMIVHDGEQVIDIWPISARGYAI